MKTGLKKRSFDAEYAFSSKRGNNSLVLDGFSNMKFKKLGGEDIVQKTCAT